MESSSDGELPDPYLLTKVEIKAIVSLNKDLKMQNLKLKYEVDKLNKDLEQYKLEFENKIKMISQEIKNNSTNNSIKRHNTYSYYINNQRKKVLRRGETESTVNIDAYSQNDMQCSDIETDLGESSQTGLTKATNNTNPHNITNNKTKQPNSKYRSQLGTTNGENTTTQCTANDRATVGGSHKKNTNNIRIQPIQVKYDSSNIQVIYNILKHALSTNSYSSSIGKNNSRIYSATKNVQEKVKEILKNHQIPFHFYLDANEKNKCLLLKGLDLEIEIDEIKNELEYLNIQFIDIKRFITGHQRAHPEIKHRQIFKIIFPNECDLKNITNIRAIFNCEIKWEQLKAKKAVQCQLCSWPTIFSHQCGM